MHLIAPSILSTDFSKLGDTVRMLDKSSADWIHIDVMDGVFVSNISFGIPVIQSIRNITTKVFDVHLMVVNPERYIEVFKQAGADTLTIHIEAVTHLHSIVHKIKRAGMMVGVALNPHTSVSLLEDILHEIDLVLVMSVNPGYGGQKFIEHTYQKIAKLSEMIKSKKLPVKIEVDGGVTQENILNLIEAGADVLVVGNTIFKSKNPIETIAKIKQIQKN